MKKIRLYNGIEMPIIGFGTARLEGSSCIKAVKEAIGMGYRLIDTAQMYHNEKEVGIAIKESGVKREDLFITSKIYSPSKSYELAKEAIATTLANLGVDYLDLMLIHEPYEEALEMYRALEEAYLAGVIKAIGISNYNKKRYLEFISKVNIKPMVNQVECHIYNDRESLHETLVKHGTVMESWSTFTALKRDVFSESKLQAIASKYHKTVAQVILHYFTSKNIVVIPKSTNATRMQENLNVFDFSLTKADEEMIKSLNEDLTLFNWYDN